MFNAKWRGASTICGYLLCARCDGMYHASSLTNLSTYSWRICQCHLFWPSQSKHTLSQTSNSLANEGLLLLVKKLENWDMNSRAQSHSRRRCFYEDLNLRVFGLKGPAHFTPHCPHCHRINTRPSLSYLSTLLLCMYFHYDNVKRERIPPNLEGTPSSDNFAKTLLCFISVSTVERAMDAWNELEVGFYLFEIISPAFPDICC